MQMTPAFLITETRNEQPFRKNPHYNTRTYRNKSLIELAQSGHSVGIEVCLTAVIPVIVLTVIYVWRV